MNRSLSRHARFLWLAGLLVPPAIALLAYELTPHDELWHEVLYSLLCIPLFVVWMVVLFGCVFSFAVHRSLANR